MSDSRIGLGLNFTLDGVEFDIDPGLKAYLESGASDPHINQILAIAASAALALGTEKVWETMGYVFHGESVKAAVEFAMGPPPALSHIINRA